MDLISVKKKTILITGASRGIGHGLAQAFVEAGAIVYGTGTSQESVERMQRIGVQGRAVLAQNQAGMSDFIASIIAEHGRLDCLVANAGLYSHTPAAFVKSEELKRIFETNVNGVFWPCQAYYKLQKKSGGTIIIISSIVALRGVKSSSIYCASKGAVQELTRALAAEWAGRNFRVNAICPGFIETDMGDDLEKQDLIKKKLVSSIPFGRMGRPKDLAGACVFLASDAASWMTGQAIVIDGGTTAILPV